MTAERNRERYGKLRAVPGNPAQVLLDQAALIRGAVVHRSVAALVEQTRPGPLLRDADP